MKLSITSICEQTVKLFYQSFPTVFPITLVYILLELGLNALSHRAAIFNPNYAKDILFIIYLIAQSLLLVLFFIFILYSIHLIHHKHTINYLKICKSCIKSYLKVIAALVVILAPILLMGLLLHFISGIFETLAPTDENMMHLLSIIMMIILIAFSIGMTVWLLMSIHFLFMPLLIVINNERVIDSLKQSWGMLRGNWLKTFCLLFILVSITTVVQLVISVVFGKYSETLISILMLPLSAAFMIVYYENIKEVRISLV
ncbi:MAG: hypothetical protein AB7V32_11055 [Candidatus Berkiella sp.]